MFTREFPAGTAAFKSNIDYIDLGLVRLAAAALTFPPERQLIDAFAHPFGRTRQVFSSFFRRFIRG